MREHIYCMCWPVRSVAIFFSWQFQVEYFACPLVIAPLPSPRFPKAEQHCLARKLIETQTLAVESAVTQENGGSLSERVERKEQTHGHEPRSTARVGQRIPASDADACVLNRSLLSHLLLCPSTTSTAGSFGGVIPGSAPTTSKPEVAAPPTALTYYTCLLIGLTRISQEQQVTIEHTSHSSSCHR